MPQERLTTDTATYHQVAREPIGIINDPIANGIAKVDAAGNNRPPGVVGAEVRSLGAAAVRFNLAFNDPTLELGDIAYSELRIEAQLEAISKQERLKTEALEELQLRQLAASPTNPALAPPADDTLRDAGGLNPHVRSTYFANQTQIKQYEAAGIKNLTKSQKNNYKYLKSQQRILRRRHSPETNFGKTRQFFRSRNDVSARNGMRMGGSSEEAIASVLEGRGRTKSYRQYAEAREDKKRRRAENEQAGNIVSRKGTILTINDRRHVVYDVVSTPAQAHRVRDMRDGKPVFETIPGTSTPKLYPMYRAKLDPATKKVMRGVDGKVIIESEPMPRDNSYRSGSDKNTGENKITEQFYYGDGTPVHTQGWGPDSFNPIDDRVVLKPLLTGDEAFEIIVNGASSAGINLKDMHVPLKRLTSLVLQDPQALEDPRKRKEILENHLIFAKSDSNTPRTITGPTTKTGPGPVTTLGARTPQDQSRDAGHFRRFDYADPRTSREITVSNYLNKYGRERIQDALKKGRKERAGRL